MVTLIINRTHRLRLDELNEEKIKKIEKMLVDNKTIIEIADFLNTKAIKLNHEVLVIDISELNLAKELEKALDSMF